MGVRMMPNATALERIPRAAYSIANDRVAALSPPLVREASTEGTCDSAWSIRLVEMATTWPPSPWDSMAAMPARVTSKKPRRFTPVMAS